MKVAYLGPQGSYSYLAAKKMKGEAQLLPYGNFINLFSALEKGEVDGAVVPIENALNGGVLQVLDLLNSSEGIIAVQTGTVNIDHRLFIKEGTKAQDIKRIYSHGQALEQCSKYLAENFPAAKLVAVQSTTAGLEMIKDNQDAAIAGAHITAEGLSRSDKNIADESNNYTRFLYLIRGTEQGLKSEKVFLSFTCQNISGALLNALLPLSKHGVNMTELQSRPIKNKCDEYSFFIVCEGDYSSEKFQKALRDFKSETLGVKILGCY